MRCRSITLGERPFAERIVTGKTLLFTEIGPLITALLVAGRVGAGIGAQLGGMRVTQQIDALEALAVDSFKFLVVTRLIACVIAMPILTTLFNFCGCNPSKRRTLILCSRSQQALENSHQG